MNKTKIIFFIFFVGFITHTLSAQKNQAVVTYQNRQDKVKILEEYTLKFRQDNCLFSKHQLVKKFISPQGYNIVLAHDYFDWYFDFKQKKATEQVRLKDGAMIWASYEPKVIDWKIEDETQIILGYKVQKATAIKHPYEDKYLGDSGLAIAWFAPDIPVPFGPYKYVGLPGLILKLQFSEASEYFIAKDIKFEPTTFDIPKQGLQVTQEQLQNPSKIDKKLLNRAHELLNNDN